MPAPKTRNYIVYYGSYKTTISASNNLMAINYFKDYYPMAERFFPDRLFIHAENQPNNKKQFFISSDE